MNITRKEWTDIENEAYSVYSNGGGPTEIVLLVIKRLEVTIDNKPAPHLGFSYAHGAWNEPVTNWKRREL